MLAPNEVKVTIRNTTAIARVVHFEAGFAGNWEEPPEPAYMELELYCPSYSGERLRLLEVELTEDEWESIEVQVLDSKR